MPEERMVNKKLLLKQLRSAVDHQIGLWETAFQIAEQCDLDLDYVFEWIQGPAITTESGMELDELDLNDFFERSASAT